VVEKTLARASEEGLMVSTIRKLVRGWRHSADFEHVLAKLATIEGAVADVCGSVNRLEESSRRHRRLDDRRGDGIEALTPERVRRAARYGAGASQLILKQLYEGAGSRRGEQRPPFRDVEFRAFSQNGEDGILLYIFSVLGMGERTCVEICAGDGVENNTANLVVNHGWRGLMVDGNEILTERARRFYASHPDTFCLPPTVVNAWITRENVNRIIEENGFRGTVDLLSLDIDGIDYWLWEAIEVIRPRVVVAEVQCVWGDEGAVSVPYAPDFRCRFIDGFGVYCGASLPAFVKLARKKGYRLVGVNHLGFNAFFVRDGEGEEVLPEVDVADCVNLPFVKWAKASLLPKVKDMPWVEV
jgi:hypothetical protein